MKGRNHRKSRCHDCGKILTNYKIDFICKQKLCLTCYEEDKKWQANYEQLHRDTDNGKIKLISMSIKGRYNIWYDHPFDDGRCQGIPHKNLPRLFQWRMIEAKVKPLIKLLNLIELSREREGIENHKEKNLQIISWQSEWKEMEERCPYK